MPHEFGLDKANSVGRQSSPPPVQTQAPEAKAEPMAEHREPAVTEKPAHEAATEQPPETQKADPGAPPAQKGDDDDLGPPDPKKPWAYSAVKQEREKRRRESEARRKAEEELAFLRGKIAAIEQAPRQDAKAHEQPSDEELDREYFSQPRVYTHNAVERAVEAIRDERRQERLEASEERAREKWQDYDETVGEFVQYLHTLPPQHARQLYDTIRRQQRDPAAYVYQQVKLAREARKMGGSVDAYMKKVEADTKARLEAEYRQKAAVAAAESVPKNMAGGSGPGLNTPPGNAGLSEWDKWKSHKKF